MEKNSCESYEADYSALLDGELASDRVAVVHSHLEGCRRCREVLEALGSVDVWLRESPAPVPSEALHEGLMARIAQEPSHEAPAVQRPAAPVQRLRRRSTTQRVSGRSVFATAAGLAAAAALAVVLLRGPGLPAAPDPTPTSDGSRFAVAPQPIVTPQPVAPDGAVEVEVARSVTGVEDKPGPVAASWVETFEEANDEQAFDIALAMDLDTVQDLDVIANLELLEALLYLEEGSG
ncbi:zf-HC2 domain-containing protein [Myxococcota bacterium]|nr:zf-HC2 domain-containing protein [Myxococcota bacterium]